MKDKNTEEKKPEEQAPPKPWIFRQLEKIQSAIKKEKNIKVIRSLYDELFTGLTSERYKLTDAEAIGYEQYAEKVEEVDYINTPIVELLNIGILIDQPEKPDLSLELWKAWWKERPKREGEALEAIDCLAISIFANIENPQLIVNINKNYETEIGAIFEFYNIIEAYYSDDPQILEDAGDFLEKAEVVDWFLASQGRNFRAKAQALRVKDEIERETLRPFREFVDKSEKRLKELRQSTNEKIREVKKEFRLESRILKKEIELLETKTRIVDNGGCPARC